MDKDILDSVAYDLFTTLPLIHRSIRNKLIKTVVTSFKEDIAPPHFEIMKLLEEAGTLHVAEIGEKLQIARPQMTHLIDRLVELDIVERETNEEDRRRLNIRLKSKCFLQKKKCYISKLCLRIKVVAPLLLAVR